MRKISKIVSFVIAAIHIGFTAIGLNQIYSLAGTSPKVSEMLFVMMFVFAFGWCLRGQQEEYLKNNGENILEEADS